MTIAAGVNKQLRIKKETAWGVAPSVGSAQLLRRVSSTFNMKKDTFQSSEINTSYQIQDFRHGNRSVSGSLSCELSPLTYQSLFESVLRKAYAAGGATTAQITITAAAVAPQFVRSAGSWITDGHKIGDVVRWTGWLTTAVANNNRNFLITALSALNMTGIFLDATAVVAKAAGDSVTVALAGKKSFAATTAQTDDSFTVEHWHSDITQSEMFTGLKVSTAAIKLPPAGMSMVDFAMVGKNLTTGTAQYFTSPTAETTTGVVAAANGAVYVGGVRVATLTGLDISISGNMTELKGIVGQVTSADIIEGMIGVTGNMTAYFEDAVLRDYFINETEVAIIGAFTTSNAANADFMTFVMNRVKVGGADKDDGIKGVVQTFPFTALLNTAGGSTTAYDLTTLTIQDSNAV